MTPAKNLSPVSLTPVINPCYGFSVIAGVVDTGDKFITGDNGISIPPLSYKNAHSNMYFIEILHCIPVSFPFPAYKFCILFVYRQFMCSRIPLY